MYVFLDLSRGKFALGTTPQSLWAGKFVRGVKAKHCWEFENKKFVDITQQCFALLSHIKIPANNLNFH